MNFTTLDNVKIEMSGFETWEFGGDASYEEFCKYVRQNWDNGNYDEIEEDDELKNKLMHDYLLSVKEDPSSYSL